jgi:hypothetical protein
MKIKIILSGIMILATVLNSCDREPVLPPEPVIEYITIAQLREMHNSGIVTVDTNVYIKGHIILTPEFGNLPDFVAYIQDSTAGICLTVEGTNSFAMNSEVKIFCRDVSFTVYNGLLQFGDISIAGQSELVNLTPAPPKPVIVTIEDLLDGEHQAEFVSIPGVQFKNPGTFSGERILTDCNSDIEVYTRSDAVFASNTLPSGNGTFKGIASVYNTTQLILRENTELDMTGNLCGVPSFIYLTQNFNSLTTRYVDVSALTGWKTFSEAGAKTWHSNSTTSLGPWIQATAFNSGQAIVITWMIAPQIDLTIAVEPYISFECANGWDNGATLELFASTDYTGSTTPWTSTWTKLPFTLPPLSPSGFGAFASSGVVDLSGFNGSTLFIAWVYKGADPAGTSNDKTTTWEVDNIVIAEE